MERYGRMINGHEVKREIVAKRYKDSDRLALLSGFVRVSFSVLRRGGERHLVLDCQTDFVRDFIASLMMEQFKVQPILNKDRQVDGDAPDFMNSIEPQQNKTELRFYDCDKLLGALYILDGDDYSSVGGIDPRFNKNAAAYARGVFLGCGSLSVPKTDGQKSGGYHLEFALGSETLVDGVTELLRGFGISIKKTVRAEKCVLYAKGGDNVCDCLTLLGAEKTMLELNNTMAYFAIKDDVNRQQNCDMANMNRAINAAVDVTDAIATIQKRAGLDTLDKKLKAAANARLQNPAASLGALAELLGISKSGLKHRYDKIVELAKSLTEGKDN